jgi:hypothetical protein
MRRIELSIPRLPFPTREAGPIRCGVAFTVRVTVER